MKTTLMLVTPQIARQILLGNIGNRKLRRSVVKAYAEQMKAGLWQKSPQTISIDIKGRLLDGQHRLHAVIEANVSVWLNVSTDVPEKSFHILDTNLTRNALDTVGLDGRKAAIASFAFQAATGVNNTRISHIRLRDFYETYSRNIDFVCTATGRGYNAAVKLACLIYLEKGGDCELIANIRRFFDCGDSTGLSVLQIQTLVKIIKEKAGRSRDKETAAIVLRVLQNGDAPKRYVTANKDALEDFETAVQELLNKVKSKEQNKAAL